MSDSRLTPEEIAERAQFLSSIISTRSELERLKAKTTRLETIVDMSAKFFDATFSMRWSDAAKVIFPAATYLLSILKGDSTSHGDGKQQTNFLPLSVRLFKLMPLSDEEQDNIIGDLLEECSRFKSNTEARCWLYKQVLKSALALVYKNLKSRLASYFGKRIR